MKKQKKLLIYGVIFLLGIGLMSFNPKTTILNSSNKKNLDIQSSNCVRIYVKWPSGRKSTNGRIAGYLCSGGTTKDFYLNNDGYADICYKSKGSLCKIYINGKAYRVDYFKKGRSYTIYRKD